MEENSKKISGEIRISPTIVREAKEKIDNFPKAKEEIENSLRKDTSEIVEILLLSAFLTKASDIHIEPQEEDAKIRMRLDGILQDILKIDNGIANKIISRVKLLSKAKLNVTDRPQDGRFTVEIPFRKKNVIIEIRMSSLPSEYGETIVMRILDPSKLITIEDLGLRSDLFSLFSKEIKKPNGMIIVTGPTGSGKTTTLYSFLKFINKPEVKTITIEDPIEYHLKGISQTEVDSSKGYDFANGLEAIVRQDPDIILVGEIRDLETAQISMQAALTGHLVFSTLHTNDAPGTISRLIALGEDVSNIAPAINIIIAQRLVRKICSRCSILEEPEEEIASKIKEELKMVKENIFTMPSDIKIPKTVGCKECNFTGYKGRVGIFEALPIDDDMEDFLSKSPSTSEIRKKAIEKGMVAIKQDGLIKVLDKITTLDEVNRVV